MSLLDTGNLSEESQKPIVSFESKSGLSNENLPNRTIGDLVAFMEEMRKDPKVGKKTRPINLAQTLKELKKLG